LKTKKPTKKLSTAFAAAAALLSRFIPITKEIKIEEKRIFKKNWR
jgi:hypothetical protein